MKIRKIIASVFAVLITFIASPSFSANSISNSESPLSQVYTKYFELKNALVSSDNAKASSLAETLTQVINSVEMKSLGHDLHMSWMKVLPGLKNELSAIQKDQSIAGQRLSFSALSKDMYTIMKADENSAKTYYQFCPMANGGKGANWLSEYSEIKNPYFGSSMLSCGKTVETLN